MPFEKLKIALQMKSSYQNGNDAGANQQKKCSTLMKSHEVYIDEVS